MATKKLMAISILNGIITLIEDDGSINCYTQRGIRDKLTNHERAIELANGRLDPSYVKYPELPKDYSIYFEAPEIMGRPYTTYVKVREKNRANRM